MNQFIIDTIKQAARARKVLRIIYIEKNNTSKEWRYVEPYSFSKDEGEQGLFAWDISKGGIRRFSLERITQVEITEQIYTPRYAVEIF